MLVNADTFHEGDQTFSVRLTNALPAGPVIATAEAFVTIKDNDPQPTIAFASSATSQGESTVTATLVVNLSHPSDEEVTVQYGTTSVGSTAVEASDYTQTSGTLTFAARETTKSVDVTILEDTINEADETVVVTLSSPTNALLDGPLSKAAITIQDNDVVSFSIVSSASVAEGNAATVDIQLLVTLSGPSEQVLRVDFATSAGGTASDSSDYVSATGTLTFNPGEESANISISVCRNTIHLSSFHSLPFFLLPSLLPSNFFVSICQLIFYPYLRLTETKPMKWTKPSP